MAIVDGKYYCDRCGKRITRNNTLCKECDIWLENYVKGRKDDKREIIKGPERTEKMD